MLVKGVPDAFQQIFKTNTVATHMKALRQTPGAPFTDMDEL